MVVVVGAVVVVTVVVTVVVDGPVYGAAVVVVVGGPVVVVVLLDIKIYKVKNFVKFKSTKEQYLLRARSCDNATIALYRAH